METKRVHTALQKLVKSMRKKPTQTSLAKAFRALDKAAKTHVIHKNKAARLKARLSKLL
jgi:ribosomal protein S20